MKKTYDQFGYPVYYAEQAPNIQLEEPAYSDAYQCAFLKEDAGIASDYCVNTTVWD